MTICQQRNDWEIVLGLCGSIFLKVTWLSLCFMVFPCKVKTNERNLLNVISRFSVCIVTISCYNFYDTFQTRCEKIFSDLNDKVTCEKKGTKRTRDNLARHKKRCSVGTFYCAKFFSKFAACSQADLKVHIPNSVAHPFQKNESFSFLNKFLLVLFPCVFTDRKSTALKVHPEPRRCIWQSCSESLTMRVLKRTWRRACSLLWTLRWKNGDIELSSSPWTYWLTYFEPKTRQNVQKSVVCSKFECCFWVCGQEFNL